MYNLNVFRQYYKTTEFHLNEVIPVSAKICDKKMIYSIQELKDLDLSYYKINKMVEARSLKKLNKNHYENLVFQGDHNDFIYSCAFIPRGVVCLMSAASYYELTTVRPQTIDIAIFRKDKVSTLPDWPQINLYYFNKERYELGIVEINNGFDKFHIYDLEKTVVDIISYREKIGIEETREILKNYLSRKDRNLNKLMRYAQVLGQESLLRTYLEVLL